MFRRGRPTWGAGGGWGKGKGEEEGAGEVEVGAPPATVFALARWGVS